METWDYSVGWAEARRLREMAASEAEKNAIERLVQFVGTADDVQVCAGIYKRADRTADAEDLLAILR